MGRVQDYRRNRSLLSRQSEVPKQIPDKLQNDYNTQNLGPPAPRRQNLMCNKGLYVKCLSESVSKKIRHTSNSFCLFSLAKVSAWSNTMPI